MHATDLWPLVEEARRALGSHYDPAMERAAADSGLPSPEWSLLFPALTFEPDSFTVKRLRIRNPYSAPHVFQARLERLVNLGALTPEGEESYRLTEAGRAAIRQVIQAAYASMAPLSPLPAEDLEDLAGLLRTVVQASLDALEPPGKWCIVNSRAIDPGDDAPVMVRIDQYITDLAAYRDDAHLAAWQPLELSGHAWEAFTVLWRGEAGTAEEVQARLPRRGYSTSDYAEALRDLADRGWAAGDSGRFQLTAQGRDLRQEVEERTDRYFFAPWAILNESETGRLRNLTAQLRDGLGQESG